MKTYAILLALAVGGAVVLSVEGRDPLHAQQQFNRRELGDSVHLDNASARTPARIIAAVQSAAAARRDTHGAGSMPPYPATCPDVVREPAGFFIGSSSFRAWIFS